MILRFPVWILRCYLLQDATTVTVTHLRLLLYGCYVAFYCLPTYLHLSAVTVLRFFLYTPHYGLPHAFPVRGWIVYRYILHCHYTLQVTHARYRFLHGWVAVRFAGCRGYTLPTLHHCRAAVHYAAYAFTLPAVAYATRFTYHRHLPVTLPRFLHTGLLVTFRTHAHTHLPCTRTFTPGSACRTFWFVRFCLPHGCVTLCGYTRFTRSRLRTHLRTHFYATPLRFCHGSRRYSRWFDSCWFTFRCYLCYWFGSHGCCHTRTQLVVTTVTVLPFYNTHYVYTCCPHSAVYVRTLPTHVLRVAAHGCLRYHTHARLRYVPVVGSPYTYRGLPVTVYGYAVWLPHTYRFYRGSTRLPRTDRSGLRFRCGSRFTAALHRTHVCRILFCRPRLPPFCPSIYVTRTVTYAVRVTFCGSLLRLFWFTTVGYTALRSHRMRLLRLLHLPLHRWLLTHYGLLFPTRAPCTTFICLVHRVTVLPRLPCPVHTPSHTHPDFTRYLYTVYTFVTVAFGCLPLHWFILTYPVGCYLFAYVLRFGCLVLVVAYTVTFGYRTVWTLPLVVGLVVTAFARFVCLPLVWFVAVDVGFTYTPHYATHGYVAFACPIPGCSIPRHVPAFRSPRLRTLYVRSRVPHGYTFAGYVLTPAFCVYAVTRHTRYRLPRLFTFVLHPVGYTTPTHLCARATADLHTTHVVGLPAHTTYTTPGCLYVYFAFTHFTFVHGCTVAVYGLRSGCRFAGWLVAFGLPFAHAARLHAYTHALYAFLCPLPRFCSSWFCRTGFWMRLPHAFTPCRSPAVGWIRCGYTGYAPLLPFYLTFVTV